MDLSLTFNLKWFGENEDLIDSPNEWQSALLAIGIGNCNPYEIWEEIGLFCNAKPMKVVVQKIRGQVVCTSDWPRSNPGNYVITVKFRNMQQTHRLSVAPQKISIEEYTLLLNDFQGLPSMVALALQKAGGLAGVQFLSRDESTLSQELLRVKRAVTGIPQKIGLCHILQSIARRPQQCLKSIDLWDNTINVRRPNLTKLHCALAIGSNIDSQGNLIKVLDNRVEHSCNTFENQLVKAYYEQVSAKLKFLRQVFEEQNNQECINDTSNLSMQLQRAYLSASFLENVKQLSTLPSKATMVLIKNPHYRAALEGYLDFHRNLTVQYDRRNVITPLRDLPHVYQVWAVLHIAKILLDVAVCAGYILQEENITRRDPSGIYVNILPKGKIAIELIHPQTYGRLRLIHEPTYGTTGQIKSISLSQRPDVAIEFYHPIKPLKVIIFDPKYKLDSDAVGSYDVAGHPKKVDIDKMHSYRDAIRDVNEQHVVEYAAILYPGRSISYGYGIEAISARPYNIEEFNCKLHEIVSNYVNSTLT